MKKKTIAILGEGFGASGRGLYPVEISKAINNLNKKYEVKLFMRDTAPYNSKFVVKIKTLKTKMRVLAGLGYYLPLFLTLRKDKSIDLIHAYDEKTNVIGSFLKKPKIVTVCDLYPLTHYKFPFNYIFSIVYRFLNNSEYMAPISHYVGKQLSKKYPFLSKKIIPIHLGTDINKFKPTIKKKNKTISIGILCNLDEELSKVFERIMQEYGKKVKIIIAGRDIPQKFNYLKSHPGVRFGGFIKEEELPKYYQEIDIFAYKSEIAAFELIPVEAMASGCAVIASNVGALPEVIKNGGLLVENSEEGFYEGIKKLVENKKLRLEYQKKGRKRAEELTWDKCAGKYIKLYDKVLRDKT